tara:strand:+ start:3463 stop:4425 length:963 start_codon:yes stop_codon:yes gene_type:complete
MHELRKSYVLNRWVIINTARGKRPQDFVKERAKVKEEGKCPFCPGNESMTPPEISRIEENEEWVMRVFPNKFPAVTLDGNSETETEDHYFTHSDGYGKHEVIVETPDHDKVLADLPVEKIKQLLEIYAERIKALKKVKGIEHVAVFKNHGPEAGTSINHEHSQIIAYSRPSTNVDRETRAVAKFQRKHKKCPWCQVVETERKGPRRCYENDSFIAFCPYASRFAFEIALFSKKHLHSLAEVDDNGLMDLAEIIKKVLLKLKELNAPYNLYLHESPKGKKLHFHIKINPRLLSWGGFEHSTGAVINTVAPEQAAEFYRKEG